MQNNPVDVVQIVLPQLQSLTFSVWPFVATHVVNNLMTMVSAFQERLLQTLITVGVGANSGRATFNSNFKLMLDDPNVGDIYHLLFDACQYK